MCGRAGYLDKMGSGDRIRVGFICFFIDIFWRYGFAA